MSACFVVDEIAFYASVYLNFNHFKIIYYNILRKRPHTHAQSNDGGSLFFVVSLNGLDMKVVGVQTAISIFIGVSVMFCGHMTNEK